MTTALLAGLGYIIGMAAVIAVSGGFVQITLHHYTGVDLPWIIWTLLLTGLSVVLMLRGVVVSTKWAGYFFGVEMLVLVVVSVAALVEHRGNLSAAPFLPDHIQHGLRGLAAGFPLAVYLFIGWENSAALAEETENPRRNVARAVFSSVAIMTVSYILFSYATVTGFDYDVARLGDARIPFIDVAHDTLGALALLAYIGGLTSTLGVLIAGINSQARLVFNACREGLLPFFFVYVHPTRRKPNNAILTFAAISLVIIGVWGLGHLLGPDGGPMNPVVFFTESSILGAILILLVYLASNIALPFYYRRYRPQEFCPIRHLVLPALGALAILVPLYYLAKPGQPAPYSWFPVAALAALLLSVAYAALLVRRDPTLAERVGSVVADAE